MGAFLSVLEQFHYAVFKCCWRCARPFWNRQQIHRDGNRCASFQEACGGYPVLDCVCWWREEALTFRYTSPGTQSWTAWAGIWRWYGGFPKVYPSIVPIGSTFTWLLVLDQLSADPAITLIRATGHQLDTLCKAMCEEEKTQVLDPRMISWYPHLSIPGVVPH